MATVATAPRAIAAPSVDPRLARAETNVRRFAMLVLPLGLLLATFRVYSLEEPAFFTLACLAFGGFAISYWLPLRYKETFTIALSLAGAYVLLSPLTATLLLASGLVMFAIIRTEAIGFKWRIASLLVILAACICCRLLKPNHALEGFWPVLGSLFMFRMIIYLYDLKHQSGPAKLKEYLSYFFLLPNYYFLLFPVVDFQTFRKGFYKRDIHTVSQQGIWWIFRGTTHLLLYRLIYQTQGRFAAPPMPVALAVTVKIISCYLLYLRVSGQFHIIAGMLCLFGYDMPETNHRYFLAHSVNDMWRRMNIYWKDFMVKIVYFPAYFKLRRKGALRAELVSTLLVVVATYVLHAYQFFWIQGKLRLSLNDALFWTILGSVMLANVWIEFNSRQNRPRSSHMNWLRKGAQIAATFAFMALLWSMWSADSISEWFYFLRTGNI